MDKSQIVGMIYDSPVIAAVKDEAGLEKALNSNVPFIFVLSGDILSILDIVERIKEKGKIAFVHIDLIDGLAPRESAIDYITSKTKADGIITTKQNLIRYGNSKGLVTVQRLFLLDSMAVTNIKRQLATGEADMYEILPGVIHKVTKLLSASTKHPIITGGLILDKDDVIHALSAGAAAVSTTVLEIWDL